MEIVVGIDGGGSSTKALVAWNDGRIIGYGESGPSNFQVVGALAAVQAVQEAVQSALSNQSLTPQVYFMGMAGVGRAEAQAQLLEEMQNWVSSAKVMIETDALIALAGGTICQPGVVIIAGTGSIAFGMDETGHKARSGGWGYLLGDEGSGFDIGRRGIVAALRELDGRGPATSLTAALLEELKLPNRDALAQTIHRIYHSKTEPRQLAGFSRMVSREAKAGDRVAWRILQQAAWELGRTGAAVLQQLHLDASEATVILAGGVLESEPLVAQGVKRYLQRQAPGITVRHPRFKPVVGALLQALLQENGLITEALLERVAAGLPESLRTEWGEGES